MKILIVDDNPDDRRVLRYLIQQRGHQAVEAQNGVEGLQRAHDDPPDLIISDALMPEMDGYQFLRAVKQDERLRAIPFVFYTSSYREDKDVRLALSLGADAFLVKPIEPIELWARIESLLQAERKQAAPVPSLVQEDAEYLKRYSEVVATKLEKKVRELEQTLQQQRRTEQALRVSEDRLRSTLEAAEIVAWEVNPVTGAHFEAGPVGKVFGRGEGFSHPRVEDFAESIHPEDRPRVLERLARALRGEAEYAVEYRILLPDGTVRWLAAHGDLQRDSEGRPARLLGIASDITERKQAEAALERDEAQLAAIYDHAPVMMCLINERREVERMNRAMAELAGAQSPTGVPQCPGDFLGCLHALEDPAGCGAGPDCGTCSLRLAMLETFQSGRPQRRVETTLSRNLQGVRTELRLAVSTAFLQITGEPKVLLCLEDITDRKRLEAQFLQAQKTEAIGQLAGGVAHDFNNILAAIMMHLGLLQLNPALDEETRQALKDLDAEARRAAALTRQLLMFSRRSVLAVKPLDLNEVVANLLKMLGRLIGEQIDLRFDGKTGLPSVEADAGMLEQVLMNLVVNARDAMPKGGRITISTSLADLDETDATANPERRPGRFVCLAVSDTGCGMNEATLKRVFEPFFTTKEAGKGTGLGLATVHGIVAQHRGWVEVDSVVSEGSTFRVFLPALARADTPIAADAQVEAVRRGRETILLVEDDTKVRGMIGQALRVLGYRVYEAANGQAAMALWQTHGAQVDLLLTDMVMPEGMTGLELTERLRALRPGLKTIISSGYSAEIVQAGVPTAAGVVYLPKPYEAKTLAEVVRNCLDRKD